MHADDTGIRDVNRFHKAAETRGLVVTYAQLLLLLLYGISCV